MFIAFDGPNGVGKSTLVERIASRLIEQKIDTVHTKEPTETELGKFLRKSSSYIRGEGLACLVAADRYQHISEIIQPALAEGKVVLCERYIASSMSFQRMDGVDLEFIMNVNSRIEKPDLYFILNASAETLHKRLQEREELTRFEQGINHQMQEEKYFKECTSVLQEQGISVYTVDMEKPLENCIDFVWGIITKAMEGLGNG